MLRRLYDWTLAWAAHPRALWVLAFVSFLESSIFPIPPDALMIPMILAAPRKAWIIAGVCTIASVAGALLGYAVGYLAWEGLGEPILTGLGKEGYYDEFRTTYAEWGAWAVLVAGVTPFPFKVITILSGAAALDVWVFLIASVVARGMRFFLVAALLWQFGAPLRGFVERHLGLAFTGAVVVFLAGFAVLGVL
jgi:membrane protein YqaA with SNARE-associated domain